jgi:hypothetical protein
MLKRGALSPLPHASSVAAQLNTETNLPHITYTVKEWHLNNSGNNQSTYIYIYLMYALHTYIQKRTINYLLYEVGWVVTEIEVELPR